MNNLDKINYNLLTTSLKSSPYSVRFEPNNRDTESLYRFGWFYIHEYKYSVSGWSFKKKVVTFECEDGTKVKYSIEEQKTIMGEFKKDNKIVCINKKIRNRLADWLKDLSDKLRT